MTAPTVELPVRPSRRNHQAERFNNKRDVIPKATTVWEEEKDCSCIIWERFVTAPTVELQVEPSRRNHPAERFNDKRDVIPKATLAFYQTAKTF